MGNITPSDVQKTLKSRENKSEVQNIHSSLAASKCSKRSRKVERDHFSRRRGYLRSERQWGVLSEENNPRHGNDTPHQHASDNIFNN